MSRRVTDRIKAREARVAPKNPEAVEVPMNIDAHSSGAKFDAPPKPKPALKVKVKKVSSK